jgi:transmembrane sensor
MSNALQIKARAADWIERRDRSDWSGQDQAALDAWLEESVAHFLAYQRMMHAWTRADRLVALRQPAPPSTPEVQARVGSAAKRFAVAAAAVFLLAGILGALFVLRPHEQTFATAVGVHRVIALSDGSSIELNTDTVVRTDVSAWHRSATLEKGEAYFQIAHDAAHPFTVTAGSRMVTVLGTKFLLRNDDERFRVALFDGSVKVTPADRTANLSASQSTVLKPGDVLVATGKALWVERKSRLELASDLGWRRGVLVFHHTPLADAADEYNRYNHQKIVIADAAAAALHDQRHDARGRYKGIHGNRAETVWLTCRKRRR